MSTKRLEPGSFAPNFKTIAFGGKVIDTHHLRGRKIWLIFYRYSTCPLCCMHLSSVVKNEEKVLARNIELMVVFETKPGLVTQSVCGRSAAHFPMIPDPSKKLYELYGTEKRITAVFRPTVVFAWLKSQVLGYKQGPMEGDLKQIPASFLIDERGVIRTAYYGKTIADHIPWDLVEKFSELPSPMKLRALAPAKPIEKTAPEQLVSRRSSANADDEIELMNDTVSIVIESFNGELVGIDSQRAKKVSLKEKVEKTITDIWRKFGND